MPTLSVMRPDLLARINSLLPSGGDLPELVRYAQMLRDYPERGGKGIRSELLLGTARAYGVREGSSGWERALWLAAALELFQNWVLIHDDIEDDSEERRGKPALHRLHGVPLAINAGDALHVYMWKAVRRSGVDRALDEFMDMVLKTAEGQHLDLAWVETQEWNLTETDYLRMVRLKTAYYTVIYPLRLGVLAAGHDPAESFEAAGLALGTAFQIRDDVLNLVGDPAKYGKEIGGDLLEGKRTLIVLNWLAGAPAQRRDLFLKRMSMPRCDKDAGQIGELLTWLRESNSLQYAQLFADREAAAGLRTLEEALAAAPDREATKALLTTMQMLATRDS